MMSFLAAFVGRVVGIGLALPLALHLRHRARRQAESQGLARPSMPDTAGQRRRTLRIAAAVATAAVIAHAAGGPGVGSPLLFLALILTGQTVLFAVVAQLTEARSRVK